MWNIHRQAYSEIEIEDEQSENCHYLKASQPNKVHGAAWMLPLRDPRRKHTGTIQMPWSGQDLVQAPVAHCITISLGPHMLFTQGSVSKPESDTELLNGEAP